MKATQYHKDPEFLVRARIRVEAALQKGGDPVAAMVNAMDEHLADRKPLAYALLAEVKRVDVHLAAENRYRLLIAHGAQEDVIELSQKEMAENHKAFTERYLGKFHVLLQWSKGEWATFVDGLLHHEHLALPDERELVNDDTLVVEKFRLHVQRWRLTRDLHQSVRDEDKVFWEADTGTVLLLSERVKTFLTQSGFDVDLQRFTHLLREEGCILRTSFQKRVPAKDPKEKDRNLRFWRLSPAFFGFTEADVMPDTPTGLPPAPDEEASPAG